MARTPQLTKVQQRLLIEALGETANVTEACKSCGVARTTAYFWRSRDEAFAAAWSEAVERGTDALEDEATRRAFSGRLEPVFYQGAECGAVRKFSDSLLMFLLRARRPEKYKERYSHEHAGDLTIKGVLDAIDGHTRGLPSSD